MAAVSPAEAVRRKYTRIKCVYVKVLSHPGHGVQVDSDTRKKVVVCEESVRNYSVRYVPSATMQNLLSVKAVVECN